MAEEKGKCIVCAEQVALKKDGTAKRHYQYDAFYEKWNFCGGTDCLPEEAIFARIKEVRS